MPVSKNVVVCCICLLVIVALTMLTWLGVAAAPTGTITVTSTADAGPGSLREALTTAGSGDTVVFDTAVYPPSAPATITLTAPLPTLTQGSLTLDASAAGVILDGSSTAPGAIGLSIRSNGNSVMGLRIVNFPHAGIEISGGAQGNVVGGSTAPERNVISANGDHGVIIEGAGTNSNRVSGNLIGTNAAGTSRLGNGGDGVRICDGAKYNVVGGLNQSPGTSCTGECNVISGNDGDGVAIRDDGTMSNTVSGNYVGTDVSGTLGLGNGPREDGIGIRYGPSHNIIGGDAPGERNVISGNGDNGVKVDDADLNLVIGNHIGTDASGVAAIANTNEGVGIQQGASHNQVGGSTSGECNLVSGNTAAGIAIREDAYANAVVGNRIGTDVTGTGPLPNGEQGVLIHEGAHDNIVGGTTIQEGNLIAYNGEEGVLVEDSASTGNTISHNAITANDEEGIENRDGGNGELPAPTVVTATCVSIVGTATPSATIEIFSDPAGEGGAYEGTTTADSGGTFTWVGGLDGPNVTTTATDADGNTSEFSNPAGLVCHRGFLPVALKKQTPCSEVFKLGILGPFSGPSWRTGDEFEGAVRMAFDDIDWRIGPYCVEPVWIDSESAPVSAAQNYEDAILHDGVEAGLLNWHSSVALACMEVVADHQIPHFSGYAATEAVNDAFHSDRERYGYWTTKCWPTPSKLNEPYVELLDDAIGSGLWNPVSRTVAICAEDTGSGHRFGDSIKGYFLDAGWTVVAEIYHPDDTTDFDAILTSLEAADPAAIAVANYSAPSVEAFINGADAEGLESVLIVDGLGWWPNWYANTGQSSDYILDSKATWISDESLAFRQAFEDRFGIYASASGAGLAYDAANYFIAVAQATYEEKGELSSETLYEFVQESIWTGKWSFKDGIMMQEYKYTEETIPDPVVGNGYYMFPILQYFDGEGKIVYPTEWADQPFAPPGS